MKRMYKRGLRMTASAALTCVALLVVPGCGDNASVVSTGTPGSAPVSNNTKGGDAGGKSATNTKTDGGTTGSGTTGSNGTTASNGSPGSSAAQPKTLMQIDECGASNAAGLSQSEIDRLKAGGSTSGLSLLYPYDKTVFPRGLTAPLMMWQGGTAKAVYVRIRAQYFEYDGCLKPGASGQVQLPQAVWEAAGAQTMGPTTPYDVQLTLLDGNAVRGPLKQQLVIAQATLKGSIFYNSYNSPLAGGGSSGGLFGGGGGGTGAVLRIKPGGAAEFFARSGTCTGCHAVSANGERMIAKELAGGRGGRGGGADGSVYQLTPTTAANPPPSRATATAAFVGLSPDGKVFINTAVQNGIGPETQGGQGAGPDTSSGLFETDTGNAVPGAGIPTTAMMPTFSSDAKLIAFNDYAQGSGKGLSLMDYDATGRKASNERSLYTSSKGYAGWPFVLPDNGAVIFTIGEMSNFSGDGVGINNTTQKGPQSDLTIVDTETGKATILARAMGFLSADDAAADKTYLPFGAEELHQSYYPTVSPVAAGGYFWVFFDSMRHYGNQGLHRQLWVTAVAIQHGKGEFETGEGLYSTDPSAPAFYLPGQELDTANHRAFTALDPCRANGASCETGIDCCSGFCTDGVCGPPSGCSKTNEACTSDSDCCSSTDRCIAGYCGTIFI